MERIKIDGKECFIRQNGNGGPVILHGSYAFRENEQELIWDSLIKTCGNKDFLLCVYMVSDWNRDFSPWPAKAAFGDQDFAGCADETLFWIEHSCIPYMKENYGEDRGFIAAGYSLAGLFSLWSMYESEVFDGVVSGSGSLWFPKWNEYVKEHHITKDCTVYLSLGKKEEKTRNAVMACVGERTREQEKKLRAEEKVKHVILEWNDGGHFADSHQRIAKGIAWTLEHMRAKDTAG